MKVTLAPIDSIHPADDNPRLIGPSAIASVAALLKEYGFRQPIVVDTDRAIVVGHTRWHAAQAAGFEKVPVHVASDLTDEQIRAYRIADNASGELTDWDAPLLHDNLLALAENRAIDELAAMTAIGEDALSALLEPVIEPLEAEPERQERWWITLSVPVERREELEKAAERLAKRVDAEILKR